MLLFRSEETIDRWCEAHGTERRPTVSLDQLWHLALPAATLTLAYLAECGLADSFDWKPAEMVFASPERGLALVFTIAGLVGLVITLAAFRTRLPDLALVDMRVESLKLGTLALSGAALRLAIAAKRS